MKEPETMEELETTVAEMRANGEDVDDAQVTAFAAKLAPKNGAAVAGQQAPLDPNRPMWHLVPPSTMQDVLDILKGMPYERVHRVMPALMQAPIHQPPPE